jgi:carboxyl-terminal processing protease
MSSSARRLVLWISAPVLAFVLLGGVLNNVTAREDTMGHLRVFNDVVERISENYVEKADMDKVMAGAMHGLVEGLDPDSAVLDPDQVKQIESNATLPAGDVGLDLTRQYYLRVIASRDNSPAAKAGIRTGDYVRLIGDKPTREMSVFEGSRLLRGAPGSKVTLTIIRGNTQDPHIVELTREAVPTTDVSSKILQPGIGYLRVSAITLKTADQAKAQLTELSRNGASKLIVDVRRVSGGSFDGGLSLARLFVGKGTLASRETRGSQPVPVNAASGDGSVTLPTTILIDNGTSGAAELFASALSGNDRADLIGERTIGRAGLQKLVRLPDGTGLWLTTTRFLTPKGTPLHEKGLEPSVAVEEPDVEFGQTPPTNDPILEKALERVSLKNAA